MEAKFFRRIGFSTPVNTPTLRIEVERVIWRAIGGPHQAVLRIYGPRADVWEVIEFLGFGVELFDRGKRIWWGRVEDISIQDKGVQVGISLDEMVNRVQVIYNQVAVAGTIGTRANTAWIQDDVSVGQFGKREARFRLENATAEQAEAKAYTELERRAFPIARHQFLPETRTETSARIICRGWWSSLSHQFYEQPGGKEGYEVIGDGLQSFGDDNTRQKVAQSFKLATPVSWDAQTIRVRMRKEGLPSDNVEVWLRADDGGVPAFPQIATGVLPALEISPNLNWHDFTLDSKVTLNPNATYWISVQRTGAMDPDNYFKIDSNESCGYTRGVFRIYNGTDWNARDPDADMLFSVSGVEETSSQIEDMLKTGQFVNNVILDVDSGIFSSPYRDGALTIQGYVEELLASGTANHRRMLATVDHNRHVRVYEEPAPSAKDYLIHADGRLYDRVDQPLRPQLYPAGVWARLKDIVPASVDSGMIGNFGRIFIEEVIYDGRTDRTTIRERDARKLLDLEI